MKLNGIDACISCEIQYATMVAATHSVKCNYSDGRTTTQCDKHMKEIKSMFRKLPHLITVIEL